MNFRIIPLLILACLSLNATAEDIALQKNHPERYTVVKGDTLWGISGKFLKDPWQWPKVWRMNRAEIKNPHRIYPGDVVVLDTSSGSPQLKLLRETVTLQPGAVVEPLEKEAIYTISPNIISPFLSQPLLIENDQLDRAPHIIAGQDNRVVLSPGTRVYVSSINEGDGAHWSIYRNGEKLLDPDTNELLGTEAVYLGDLNVTRYGSPASADIIRAKEEIFARDRIVVAPDEFKNSFLPHAPDSEINGRIIRIYGGVAEGGPNTVVSINRGKNDGLEEGHVLAISRHGRSVRDPEFKAKKDAKLLTEDEIKNGDIVKLPNERVGLLMVFRAFDRVSYALIMNASDAVYTLDSVNTP
ncbi:MAG TPA: LysM peptidoglycan-binding domain-containing protein [Methylophilus sp.]|nr:LysM peptidoglycan-binding domain-containing protein [Methylophilus sp.]HQQ33673.1 LysM peptidoglycan-binding domain-containing protein [Methylophilus sp.]